MRASRSAEASRQTVEIGHAGLTPGGFAADFNRMSGRSELSSGDATSKVQDRHD
jgi:hypothetical protein